MGGMYGGGGVPAQGEQGPVSSFGDADSPGLSLELLSRALYMGLTGIVVMLLLSSIADPLFRLLDLDAVPTAFVHRLHDLGVFVHSLLLLVAPLVLSFRSPEERPALMALALSGALITFAMSLARGEPDLDALRFVALLTVLAVLHPGRRRLLSLGLPSRPLFGLALVATLPWTAYGVIHVEFAGAGVGPVHGSLGHWQHMAGLGFTLAFAALYAACRPAGWRFVAWLVGLATGVMGFISVIWPRQASSLGLRGGLVALAWAVAWCVLAQRIADRDEQRNLQRVTRSRAA